MPTHRVLYLLGPEHVELRREPIPRPAAGEVLLRLDAATTCGTDLKVFKRGGHPTMLSTPCPFGHEMTGTLAAIGAGTPNWREGDAVVVANSASCGQCRFCRAGRENLCVNLLYLNGAFAEYLLVPEDFVRHSTYRRPDGLKPALAAMTEPLACVFHGLSACCLDDVTECIILGAGPIGLMFVAELAHRGIRVILGDLTPQRLEVGQLLGASDTVLVSGDRTDGDTLRAATEYDRGAQLVIEATGFPTAWSNSMEAVAPGGEVILFGGCTPGTTAELDTHRLHYSEITVKGVYHHRPATVQAALDRLTEGTLPLEHLLQERCDLDGIEGALGRMASRKILKAVVTT
ncbi:MAG: dehydrogenase [Acidobacteria bacterium]|nr:MAG: dehydrogenase [Acidobacteriota bacterium]